MDSLKNPPLSASSAPNERILRPFIQAKENKKKHKYIGNGLLKKEKKSDYFPHFINKVMKDRDNNNLNDNWTDRRNCH